jgi:hypothetical protein
MKKLILSATLMAFAVAAQAGEAKTSTEKAACCTQAKTTQVKNSASCPLAAKDAKTCSATASACSGSTCKDTPTKQALLSPKAAAEVVKKL